MTTTAICGLETGDSSEIGTLTTGWSVVAGEGRFGNYALDSGVANNAAQTIFSGLSLPRIHLRFGNHWQGTPIDADYYFCNGVEILSGAVTMCFVNFDYFVRASDGTDEWNVYFQDTTGTTVPGLTIKIRPASDGKRFHNIEVDVTVGGTTTTGSASLYVDGALIATATGTVNLGSISNITGVQALAINGSPSLGMSMRYDDFAVNDAALLGIGGSIARQWLSTVPTYNTWVKSSGSTIDTVWNDTPFSATTSANSGSITTALAQTAVVHSFSTTQAGHGSGVINPLDVINGIVVGAVAKTSATSQGGSSGNVRRRFNGVDNDTAVTITTLDAFYKTAVFTDTLTNLNTAQGGWNKAVSTAVKTQTVEDAIMIVDYTPDTLMAQASL